MASGSGFLSQKLTSLIHAVSLFLIQLFLNFSRLRKVGFWWRKNGEDSVFLETGSEAGNEHKSELHLKFKFPTFDEFRRIQKGRDCSTENIDTERRSVSAFIEVLTTFPLAEISPLEYEDLSQKQRQEEDQEVIALEFAENKVNYSVEGSQDFVDESEFHSERSSDDFLSDGENEAIGFEENKELKERVEEHDFHNAVVELSSDFLSEKDFIHSDKKQVYGLLSMEEGAGDHDARKSKEDECGDANKLESLWEHHELIEQLQMELRKVKATGLPTIIEESECSPKIVDDLKAWKIDEETDKLQHQDCMGELHKFYKSYREMMRKFDILNYQKMYAMGFLQLKDPFQSTSQRKHERAPILKSLVSQNLWLFKHKRQGSSPIKKLINELEGDVEVVYVGQTCLSWEFLRWQYEKALHLWNSDPQGVHRYNEVAAEFQQFQVLLQRFTEDAPYQGPRVQSYVKSRCVLRNLLQVPLIREDFLEDKHRSMEAEYMIASDILVEMVEESIRIFWEFVASDKDCSIVSNKVAELHSTEDLKMLIELKKMLQKKVRRLKDVLRSEKCILKKWRKRRGDDSDQALQFFAQVDVKLVCRVLNMSRISRDQLLWCQNKLSMINFVNKKIYVEPAFLLFPC